MTATAKKTAVATPNKFAAFLVEPIAEVGQRFTQNCSRTYRDARGQQTETFTVLLEVTKIDSRGLDYTVLEVTDIVNPYEFFSRPTGGGIMGFAFNRDLAAGRYIPA